MKPSLPQIRKRPLALILGFLSITAASAWANPPGIYTISRTDFLGRPEIHFEELSGDGSIVQSEHVNWIWSHPDGLGPLFPDGFSPFRSIADASPDMSILLGRDHQLGFAVATRDGSRVTPLEPSGSPGIYPTALSPDGQYAAGKFSLVGHIGLQADVGRWRVGETYQSLPRLPDFAAANVVSVNDEGVVYGHGFVAVPYTYPGQPVPGYEVAAAVRWLPDGTLERLAGTDESGRGWRLQWIDDISADGSKRLGQGFVEREAASGGGSEEILVHAVFDDSGVRWLLWDVDADLGRPYQLGLSADGSRAYGHAQTYHPDVGYFGAPRIYSPDGGSVDFEVFLQSMGLDTSNWEIGSIIDMSDDGNTFLAYGSERGGNGFQVLIVVPEPSVATLLGMGLIGLSRVGVRRRRVRYPS